MHLKKENDSLEVPANAYRLCAITGIQPLSAMGLFGYRQSGVGLSTRFLFAPNRDPAFPAQRPGNPAPIRCFPFSPRSDAYRNLWEQFKEPSHELYSAIYSARGISGLSDAQREQWHHIRFVLPPQSENDRNDDRIRKNLGTGDDGNAHLLQIRERLAAILTILGHPYRQPEIKDGKICISVEDWKLTAYVALASKRERDRLLHSAEEQASNRQADKAIRYQQGREAAEDILIQKTARTICRKMLRDYKAGKREGISHSEARNCLNGRYPARRMHVDDALDFLEREGAVIYMPDHKRWRLAEPIRSEQFIFGD